MANITLRSAIILAVLASTGSAFRHNYAKVMNMKDIATTSADPPDINAMMEEAVSVAAAKRQAAKEAYQAAQEALMNHMQMNMSRNNQNRRANNTRGRNASHNAVDDMYAAKNAELVALEIEAKVTEMKEVCTELIAAVQGFQVNTETRALAEMAAAKKQRRRKHKELVDKTIEAEKLDLSRLLGLLDEIAAAKAQVTQLDAKVQSGAADAIVQATGLVDHMAAQLRARLGSLESVDAAAFAAMQLEPEDAELAIDGHTRRSLDKVGSFLDGLVARLNREYGQAQAAMQAAFEQNKRNSTSKNALHDMVNNMYAINEQVADAGELREAITHAIQAITNFFQELGGYKARQAAVAHAASLKASQIVAEADDILRAIEESVLADGGIFFHLYQLMWVRHNEAKEAMPDGDDDYVPVSQSITATAEAIHAWLNGEMMSYCDKYPPTEEVQADANAQCNEGQCSRFCQGARGKLIAAVIGERESTVPWCDERFTKTFCVEENAGLAPNGKACKWKEGDLTGKTGIRGRCKPNRAPTKDLPYGRKDPTGEGLFA